VSRSAKDSLQYDAATKAVAVDSLPDKHDIARHCKVTVRTVDRWTKDRLIPSIKLGPRCTRFRWADVERAINRLTVREVK
jgi:predicted DNA-binding transcriptional regulator AlpA